jgi:hypothetical protein
MIDWIGSRRLVDQYPEFVKEVYMALREYRGPGIYKQSGERIAPIQKSYEHRGPIHLNWIRTEEEYKGWVDGTN